MLCSVYMETVFLPALFFTASTGHDGFLFTMFVMFVAAKLAAELFERLRQPAVAGEILAGVLIGPSVLHWVAPGELTSVRPDLSARPDRGRTCPS